MITPRRLYNQWQKENTQQRFGQWFINHYIKSYDHNDSWWELLWNTPSVPVANDMIRLWLIDNQYTDTLPPRIHP